jgi:lipase (class 3)
LRISLQKKTRRSQVSAVRFTFISQGKSGKDSAPEFYSTKEKNMGWSYPTNFNASTAITYANFVQQAYFQYYVATNTPQSFGYPPFSTFIQVPPTGYTLTYNLWYNESLNPFGGWAPAYFGYVCASQANPKQLVMVIRGTENGEEWTDDIFDSMQEACPVANSTGLVHEGFGSIYKGLLYYTPPSGSFVPPTKQQTPVPLSQVVAGAQSVMVTGHSLGAALATLLTLDIALNCKVPVSSYNFASPTVGDPTFAAAFNAMIGNLIGANYRVANGVDPVPNQPSSVFYAPGSSQELDYMQVNGYCPVDSGLLSLVSDPHSLSNYVIGLTNLGSSTLEAKPGQRQRAGLRAIPRWKGNAVEAEEQVA